MKSDCHWLHSQHDSRHEEAPSLNFLGCLEVLVPLFFVPHPARQKGIHFHSGEKTEPVISNLLGGRRDGFTGSIITCYMERSIMEYAFKKKGIYSRNSIQKQSLFIRGNQGN